MKPKGMAETFIAKFKTDYISPDATARRGGNPPKKTNRTPSVSSGSAYVVHSENGCASNENPPSQNQPQQDRETITPKDCTDTTDRRSNPGAIGTTGDSSATGRQIDQYDLDEKAAILEFDAGMSREEAEREADKFLRKVDRAHLHPQITQDGTLDLAWHGGKKKVPEGLEQQISDSKPELEEAVRRRLDKDIATLCAILDKDPNPTWSAFESKAKRRGLRGSRFANACASLPVKYNPGDRQQLADPTATAPWTVSSPHDASATLPFEKAKWPPTPRYLLAELERAGVTNAERITRAAWHNATASGGAERMLHERERK